MKTNEEMADFLEKTAASISMVLITLGTRRDELKQASDQLRARAQEPQGPVRVRPVWVAGFTESITGRLESFSWLKFIVIIARDRYVVRLLFHDPPSCFSGGFDTLDSAKAACEQHCIAMLAGLGISAVIDREQTTGETK